MEAIQKLIIFIMLGLMLCSCEATVAWSGQTYTGTITENSYKEDVSRIINRTYYQYYECYDVGCAGEWTIEVESLDWVDIYIEAKENGCELARTFMKTVTSDKISFTHKFDQTFRLYLKIPEDEVTWNNNSRSARYSIYLKIN